MAPQSQKAFCCICLDLSCEETCYFVAEGPSNKELLSNCKKAPGAARHQTLLRAIKNVIKWNIPEIKKAKQRI